MRRSPELVEGGAGVAGRLMEIVTRSKPNRTPTSFMYLMYLMFHIPHTHQVHSTSRLSVFFHVLHDPLYYSLS